MAEERDQAIRERAYAIWEDDGRPDGKHLAHWLQAEAEIGARSIAGVTDDGKIVKSAEAGGATVRRRRS